MIDGNTFSDIYDYCRHHSDQEGELLYALYRETQLKTLAPRMASGALQGRLLSFISKLFKPKSILEIGTFTGYATICLAEGLHKDGSITTIEINPELDYISDKYFRKIGIRNKIKSITGNAKEIIPRLNAQFDLVFIDAAKRDYLEYYELIFDSVISGGLILADNVLWDGKVIKGGNDKTTEQIIAFNDHIKNDERVQKLMLPLRDGISIIQKK